MNRFSLIVLCSLFALGTLPAFGACYAVGPTAAGNGSGSDWNNRMNRLPSLLTRGDTYYLMDGSYGSYNFTTPMSGTTRIVVKKAQGYDFGRTADGCPNDISAGWNEAAMGSSQAEFTAFDSSQSARGYLTLDGNGTSNGVGCGTSPLAGGGAKDCGIKLVSSRSDNGPLDIGVNDGFVNRTNGWTIRYVEWQGGGDNPSTEQNGIWCRNGCDNLLIDHVYWHDSGTDFIKLPASNSAIIRHSHFRQNFDNSTYHGQFYIQEGGTSNVHFFGNVIQDIQGTGYWVLMTGGSTNGMYIYNNVILKTAGSTRPNTSNGILACINGGTRCANINFIGNTIVNAIGGYSSQGLGINSENNNGSSYNWQNNLFFNSGGIGFNLNGAGFNHSNNTYLNSGSPSGGSSNSNITVASGAPSPFVDWQGYRFQLALANGYLENAANAGATFDIDMAGMQRSSDGLWNRGAFEYSTGLQRPAPPTNLSVIVR
jgi:hypothetical protein